MDRLNFAKYFATQEHVMKRQQTYGVLPYTHHLADVEAVLRRFPMAYTEDLLVAAWLHDIVEDCEVKLKYLIETFGERVAALVDAVTDEPGPNRKARKLATYEKTRSIPGGVVLKLADRIANVEAGGQLVQLYVKEHDSFRRGLYSYDPNVQSMWVHLDGLIERAAKGEVPPVRYHIDFSSNQVG